MRGLRHEYARFRMAVCGVQAGASRVTAHDEAAVLLRQFPRASELAVSAALFSRLLAELPMHSADLSRVADELWIRKYKLEKMPRGGWAQRTSFRVGGVPATVMYES